MPIGSSDALASDYYLANFHSLAGFVHRTYSDLLTDAETAWYTQLCDSDISSQQLYIRLLTRKGSVFRVGKLNYPEISSVSCARAALAKTQLASDQPPESLSVLLAAFTKPEIHKLIAQDMSASHSRADLVDQLLNAQPQRQAEYVRTLQCADEWVTVRGHQNWVVFTLCFFGNLYQDSSEFVLRELGTVRYEDYRIDPDNRAFSSRDQLDAHLRYFECEALYDTIDHRQHEPLEWLVSQLPQPLPGDRHLDRRLDRFRNRIARQLERLGYLDRASELYRESKHPPARERLVRIHMKQGKPELAAALADEMARQPVNDAEQIVAYRLKTQVDKARGMKAVRSAHFRPDTTRLTLKPCDDRVEFAARSFYSRFGSCYYTENALVSSVLGLFIWDIIFHPVRGVFFNPFQSAPSDFYEPEFRIQRADLLAARFAELDNSLQFCARVMHGYSEHRGKANPLVRWGRLSEELLSLALQFVPAEHWKVLFTRLLQDPRENTTGFPDLVLFREDGGYEFIEIKGPGDTLQQNQRRWMQYFAEWRIPCRVVNVRWGTPFTASPD